MNIRKIISYNWVVSLVGISFVFVYFLSIFVYPFITGGWDHTQKVLHSWQALNVGFLAFISSLIAFYISRYNAEKQREREFVAAKAFLPNALSDLTEYFICCAEMLCEALSLIKDEDRSSRATLKAEIPVPLVSISEVFRECIRHGSPDISEHIANILKHLQVNNSRLKNLHTSWNNSSMLINKELIKDYIFDLANIQALVTATFDFARGEEKFVRPDMRIGNITKAYLSLEINRININCLNSYTKDRFERENA